MPIRKVSAWAGDIWSSRQLLFLLVEQVRLSNKEATKLSIETQQQKPAEYNKVFAENDYSKRRKAGNIYTDVSGCG